MSVNAGLSTWGFSKMAIGVIDSGFNSTTVMHWGPIGAPVAEAILDSKNDELAILSQIPTEWKSGKVVGMRARGGYQLSISWSNGKLDKCIIDSPVGTTPFVRYDGVGVNIGMDSRFVINRSATTLEKLIAESEKKLSGPYTDTSKQDLRNAIVQNDCDIISQALLHLDPVKILVTVIPENGKTILTQVGETLSFTATSENTTASYIWSVTALDGGETKAATITQEGILTAVSRERVLVKALLQGGSGTSGSIEIDLRLPPSQIKAFDDRDSAIQYSAGWNQWEEAKHHDGTLTYSHTVGATAMLDFVGTGIEVISSMGNHMGAFSVTIDGVVVEPVVMLNFDGGLYATSVYKRLDLEQGDHTIIITNISNSSLKTQLDIDAFVVYNLEKQTEYLIHTQISGGTAAVTTTPLNIAEADDIVEFTIDDVEDQKRVKAVTVKDDINNNLDLQVITEYEKYSFTMPDSAAYIYVTLEDSSEPPASHYNISVIGGAADKVDAAQGEVVTIVADAPPAGHFFVKWKSDDVTLNYPDNQTTSFIMPANDVLVVSVYADLSDDEFSITVVNGNSDMQSALEGALVTIEAHKKEGQIFTHWSSSDVVMLEEALPTATFTMPGKNIVITANFKVVEPSKETYTLSVIASVGGVVNADISGQYLAGEKISLIAHPEKGYKFGSWISSDGGTYSDTTSINAVFTMPANDVKILAQFALSDAPGGKTPPEITEKTPSNWSEGTSKADTVPNPLPSSQLKTAPQTITKEQAIVATRKAIEKALQSGLNNVQVGFVNVGKIELSTLQAIQQETKLPVIIHGDTLSEDGKTVIARMYINPKLATQSLSLLVSVVSKEAVSIKKIFNKYFLNKVQVVAFEQRGDLGSDSKIAIKLDPNMISKDLAIYTYTQSSHSYQQLKVSVYVDGNGYLHFPITEGSVIIISDGYLEKR